MFQGQEGSNIKYLARFTEDMSKKKESPWEEA
jgi:hypothetical protein